MKYTLFVLCSLFLSLAYADGAEAIANEKKVKRFVEKTATSAWIVVYNKSERFVRVTDYNHQERSIVIPENEGLVFINDIIKDDPGKVKKFQIVE